MPGWLTSSRSDGLNVASYLPGTSPRKRTNSIMKWPKLESDRDDGGIKRLRNLNTV
jgi:hypothetical protein